VCSSDLDYPTVAGLATYIATTQASTEKETHSDFEAWGTSDIERDIVDLQVWTLGFRAGIRFLAVQGTAGLEPLPFFLSSMLYL
jgi:hypothetical protein